MTWKSLLALAAVQLLFLPAAVRGDEGRIFTLWPLVDYRRSDAADYTSVHLLGPLGKYERRGTERVLALRPLYHRAEDTEDGSVVSEFLYPVASRKAEPGRSFFQGVHLLSYDFGSREAGSDNEFLLFPFVFAGRSEERGEYFALFPLGGTIYDKFGRDEIRFTLFPLYARTQRRDTTVTNVLWPVFARIRGEEEAGVKLWPLFGRSEKTGVYRKRFYLWPVVFRYDLALDTVNPVRRRAVFPLYVGEESPQRTSRTYLWPFFSHIADRRRDYEEWNFPWPLLRVSRGAYREGEKFLPLYADERTGAARKRWFLWPVYKIEETRTEVFERRRDRILYFLYSDLEERLAGEESPRKKRVALWPLFTYEETDGVALFHTLSLLEPFFPENAAIRRNWSPLWRLYQRQWDGQGNEVSTLLWNLYWKERRGADLAVELFPLYRYRREAGKDTELQLLKGLLRLRTGEAGGELGLLYLPWGVSWQKEAEG